MSKLKYETKKVVEVGDWDDLVQKTYGRPYCFQQQDDCRNRGVWNLKVPDEAEDFEDADFNEDVNEEEMGVSFKTWLERDPNQPLPNQVYDWELRMWWERNFYPDVQMIANDLHEKGLLEAGEYLINVDW